MTDESERPDSETDSNGDEKLVPEGESNGDGREHPETEGEEGPGTDSQSESGSSAGSTGFDIEKERILTALQWGALLAFAVLILVAGSGLYSSLGSIIDIWVADRYQPIARAGVNLAILCAAVGGVVATLRRL